MVFQHYHQLALSTSHGSYPSTLPQICVVLVTVMCVFTQRGEHSAPRDEVSDVACSERPTSSAALCTSEHSDHTLREGSGSGSESGAGSGCTISTITTSSAKYTSTTRATTVMPSTTICTTTANTTFS
ncbi:hypothetical protein FHG87_015942 [Trinorchestia longiramus]|nr:hypothetical protein FHG87_015942 [Trinorchestia longiramus]